MKTVIYHGREYESVIALCRALGISQTAYYHRKAAGVPLTERIRPAGEWLRKPVTIKGVEYPSVIAYCDAKGVSTAAFYQARKAGRNVEDIKSGWRECEIDGVRYPSIRAASRALKLSYEKVKVLIESQNQTECTK